MARGLIHTPRRLARLSVPVHEAAQGGGVICADRVRCQADEALELLLALLVPERHLEALVLQGRDLLANHQAVRVGIAMFPTGVHAVALVTVRQVGHLVSAHDATSRHSPNAVIFGGGAIEIRHMLRAGVILDVVGIIVVSLAILALGTWVLGPG